MAITRLLSVGPTIGDYVRWTWNAEKHRYETKLDGQTGIEEDKEIAVWVTFNRGGGRHSKVSELSDWSWTIEGDGQSFKPFKTANDCAEAVINEFKRLYRKG